MEIQNADDKEAGKDTVFHGLLHNDLPESEKSMARLVQEAHLIIMAGQDSTGTITFPWLLLFVRWIKVLKGITL